MGTRKQQPQRRRSKKTPKAQKGGDANWFQYTDRPVRRLWVEKLYPLGDAIFSELKKIPWDEYKFKGYTLLNTEIEGERNDEIKKLQEYLPVVAKAQSIPYYILGGAACEAWHRMYPRAGNLHATTDPTADIDIKLAHPYFKIDLPNKVQKNYFKSDIDWYGSVYDGDTYSTLVNDYTMWVFYEVVDMARRLQKFVPSKGFRAPKPENTGETSHADQWVRVGPFLVARVNEREAGMIKIQITTTVKEGDLEHTDHLVEFIMVTRGGSIANSEAEVFESKDSQFNSIAVKEKGIFVQKIFQLIIDQAKAAVGRAEVDPEIRYKLINHYGRLLYLTKLLRWALDHKMTPMLAAGQIKFITDYVVQGVFSPKEGVCPPPRGCSARAFLDPLKPYIKLDSPFFKELRNSGFTFSPDA